MSFNKKYVAVVNYNAGNVRSVQKALEKFGATAVITSNPSVIKEASALVFPGQGASDSSMEQLKMNGLDHAIREFVNSGKPFLGVCLGLQLLLNGSDEGREPGLGLIKGWVRELPDRVKIPHIGWNQVKFVSNHPVFKDVSSGSFFYFVHSYYADPENKQIVTGLTDYGLEFCSALCSENVVAVQFHPEKSGDLGLRIYKNFLGIVEDSVL